MVFDQSDAEGVSFNLQQVIAGWTEGITYFKKGGNGILLNEIFEFIKTD